MVVFVALHAEKAAWANSENWEAAQASGALSNEATEKIAAIMRAGIISNSADFYCRQAARRVDNDEASGLRNKLDPRHGGQAGCAPRSLLGRARVHKTGPG
jgi:hypothetical protein